MVFASAPQSPDRHRQIDDQKIACCTQSKVCLAHQWDEPEVSTRCSQSKGVVEMLIIVQTEHTMGCWIAVDLTQQNVRRFSHNQTIAPATQAPST